VEAIALLKREYKECESASDLENLIERAIKTAQPPCPIENPSTKISGD
jgi:hypothetical protein